jgi:hypothetical protein
MCACNVVGDHFAADGLAADVPNLQRRLELGRNEQAPNEEIHTNGLLVLLRELVFSEPG